MKVKRSYPLRLIRHDYTYTVQEVSDLFELDIATVRRWMNDEGLKRIPKTRPALIHSSELKAFLNRRQQKRKKPCAPNEAFCCKCQKPQQPKIGSAAATQLSNGTFRICAVCAVCGSKVGRVVKQADWSESHPLAMFLPEATKQYSGGSLTPHKCSLEKEEQLCLDITP